MYCVVGRTRRLGTLLPRLLCVLVIDKNVNFDEKESRTIIIWLCVYTLMKASKLGEAGREMELLLLPCMCDCGFSTRTVFSARIQ
jgi:hypothetical protein